MKNIKEDSKCRTCVYADKCAWDIVYSVLCGRNYDYYIVALSGTQVKNISVKTSEILEMSSHQVDSLGSKLGIDRNNLSLDRYRLLVAYKVQEDIRQQAGVSLPERVRENVKRVLSGPPDGLLIKETEEVNTDMASKKGSEKAKDKMAKVREAKGKRTGPSIREIAEVAITAGKSFDDAQKAVLKVYPDSRFSKASYAWYKNKL